MIASRYASISVALLLALMPAACAYIGVDSTPLSSPSPVATVTPSVGPSPTDSPSLPPTLGPLPPTLTPSVAPTPHHDGPRKVPSLVVKTAETTLEIRPYTYCYRDTCADGEPPDSLPSIGNAESAELLFPISDWEFSAYFAQADERCALTQAVQLDQNPDGNWDLEPTGYADRYEVGISAFSPEWEDAIEWGDAFYAFEWTTPRDGPLAVPSSDISLLYMYDGQVEVEGVTMHMLDVATAARSADAHLTVTADNGESLSFDLEADPGCAGSGDLRWAGPDDEANQVPDLGPPPFTYHVVVRLDGQTYEAHAVWPPENLERHQYSMPLQFSPPLPALQPRE